MELACLKCHVIKDEELFSRDSGRSTGRQAYCKACEKNYRDAHKSQRASRNAAWKAAHPERVVELHREWQYRTRYGVNVAWYDETLAAQAGGCRICRTKSPGSRNRFFCVDHKHVEGYDELPPEEKRKYVRGLLCVTCNLVVGKLEEMPGRFEAYLVA